MATPLSPQGRADGNSAMTYISGVRLRVFPDRRARIAREEPSQTTRVRFYHAPAKNNPPPKDFPED